MKELKLVAKGGVLSLLGDATNYFFSYVFLFIASHWLGASLLGAYYWALSIASLLGEFADLGTGQGLIYFSPKYETEKGENASLPLFRFILGFVIANALILGLLLFVFAPALTSYFHKEDLIGLLRLFSITLPFSLFWPVLYKYCVGRFQIVPGIVYGDVFRPLVRVLTLVVLTVTGLTAWALAGTELVVGLVLMAVGLILIVKLWGSAFFAGRLTWREKGSILLYSLPFLPLNLARGERLIIIITGFFLMVGDLGVFGVALKVAALSQVILTGLNFVFRPMVSKLYTAGDLVTLKSVYRAITRWIFMLTLPLSFFFIIYPTEVLQLFGPAFSGGAAALVIISFGYLFEYGTSATQVIINMTGRSWLSLFNQLVYLAVVLALGTAMIPSLGMIGAAAAVAAGIVVVNLFRLYQSWRIVGFLPYSIFLWKPVAAMVGAGFVVMMIPVRSLAVVLPVYLIVYAGALLLLKLNDQDRALLLGLWSKADRNVPDIA
jgi:O-antigen/teichoic acid export membrane protein